MFNSFKFLSLGLIILSPVLLQSSGIFIVL